MKEKKDTLGYMGKLRKKVQGLIADAENFITSVHKTNPFKDSNWYFEDIEILNEGVSSKFKTKQNNFLRKKKFNFLTFFFRKIT